ncbi:hypothetical protein GTW56_28065 [Bacillus sp. EB93]|nr:hypothetical protein [Peribacillus frigoritolerans]
MPFHNTNIRYKHGLINLKDFPRGKLLQEKGNKKMYQAPKGIEVLTIWNGEEKWLPVEGYSVYNNLTILEVKTNTSRTIQVSDDHSLATVDQDLYYKRDAAFIGMTLPRLRKPIKMDEYDLISSMKLPNTKESKYSFKDEVPLDFNFGYLNGVYIGDGWISRQEYKNRHAIYLASDSDSIPRYIQKVMNSYLEKGNLTICTVPSPHEFDGKESYCEKHTWYSSKFSEYFRQNIGRGAIEKQLPPFWINTPESFRWGLLSGLIDTDGSFASNTAKKTRKKDQFIINYTTISSQLAYEIVGLAHSVDLTASVTVTQTPKGKECYVVTFTQDSMLLMQDKVLLQTPKKAESLLNFKTNPSYKRNRYTPKLSDERLTELRKAIGSPTVKNRIGEFIIEDEKERKRILKRKSLNVIVNRVQKQNTAITLQTAKDIFELNLSLFENPFWTKWKNIVLDENIDWELITEIKTLPLITEAYDLTIHPAYTMVIESGIIVYNTMAAHLPLFCVPECTRSRVM